MEKRLKFNIQNRLCVLSVEEAELRVMKITKHALIAMEMGMS